MTQTKTFGALLFDLDGTLIDTAPDFVSVLNQMLVSHGKQELPQSVIRQQVSNGARALTQLGFGDEASNTQFQSLLDELLDRYVDHIAVYSRLFDGLEECLQKVEQYGIPWGIVTNKPSRFTEPLLHQLNLSERCSVTICPDHVTHKKPHPEPIYLACKKLGIEPSHAIYVGDHGRDIEAGNNAGSFTIAAGWGYLNESEDPSQWNADKLCQDVSCFSLWISQQLETL